MMTLFNLFSKKPQSNIIIFCGSGVSQESGIDTFRDTNGLWSNYDLNEVCNFKTFQKNREKAFHFYNERKKEILQAQPNKAHTIIAQLQKTYGAEHVKLFTSNIDDLLERSGCVDVVHVHGDIFNMQCTDCGHVWNIGSKEYDVNMPCMHCQSLITKPNIVLFNETAPKYRDFRLAFESSGNIVGNYKNRSVEPHIKLIVGTSFNVIKLHDFYPERSRTIVVDKNFVDKASKVEQFITLPATEGLPVAQKIINAWYK